MKKNILSIFVTALALLAQADSVSTAQARKAAAAWAARNVSFGVPTGATVTGADEFKDANGVKLWYQVYMSDGTCLIVSPVTELEPVIAVLENVGPEGLPEAHPMRAMLTRDMTDRLRKLGLYPTRGLMGASPSGGESSPLMDVWAEQGRAKWARLLPPSGIRLMVAVTNGEADVGMAASGTVVRVVDGFGPGGRYTHWNQSEDAFGKACYNKYTPKHYPCGCVATAMAAMLQFFAVDATKADLAGPHGFCTVEGQPAPEYVTLNSGGLFDGYDVYDWSALASLTSRADFNDSSKMTDDVRDLLGRVAYDAGVMLSMDWASGGSGTQTGYIADALKFFGKLDMDAMKPIPMRARAIGSPQQEQYAKFIYSQCRAGAPVALGIHREGALMGHAVLAVGYGMDNEGNERVRIFTGWGGAGDGWYALPYINTKSLPGATTANLFDVVTAIVTMVGYEDEGIVPLIGKFIGSNGASVANQTIEVQIRNGDTKLAVTNVTTDANGYFGVRVQPSPSDSYWLECAATGDEMKLSLRSDLMDLSTAELLEALPSPINFPRFVDFESAKEVATARGCPLFCLSGAVNGAATNMLDMVDSRFVQFWISDASASSYDGNPSCAVFLPPDFEPSDRWQYTNGRLAYGYAYSREDTWDDVQDANETVVARTVVQKGFYAICLKEGQAITNDFRYVDTTDGVAKACEYGSEKAALKAMVRRVLDDGWDEYCRYRDGIVLTVESVMAEVGTPNPTFGTHMNTYTNGQTITAYAPDALVTNANMVLEFNGWTLTNETTGTSQAGTGTTATFTVASNDVVTLTWLSATNAVWINVTDKDGGGTTYRNGAASPASGWYPYGSTVVLVAIPDAGYAFSQWSYDANVVGSIVDDFGRYAVNQPALAFVAERPLDIMAGYDLDDGQKEEERAAALAQSVVLNVKAITNRVVCADANVPATDAIDVYNMALVATIPANGSATVHPVQMLLRLQASTFTDAAGDTWECVGWRMGGATGDGTSAGITPSDATNDFEWLWEKAAATPGPAPLPPATAPSGTAGPASSPISLTPIANGNLKLSIAVGNAVAGYYYVLVSSTDVSGPYVNYTPLTYKQAATDGVLALPELEITPTEAKRFFKVRVVSEDPSL